MFICEDFFKGISKAWFESDKCVYLLVFENERNEGIKEFFDFLISPYMDLFEGD